MSTWSSSCPDRRLEPQTQLGPPPRGQPTLEHRQLQPSAIAVHHLEDAPPALVVGDVVGDDIEPLLDHQPSPHQIMRIFVDLAGEEAGEQPRLHFEQPAHGDPIAEDRMRHLLIEATLVGGDEGPPRMRLEVDRRPGGNKAVRLHLTVVDRPG